MSRPPVFRCVAVAILLGLLSLPGSACTTFCLRDGERILFGKNYDWEVGEGLLVVNQRGVAKQADTGERLARWVSRYGSVTFNQYGRGFPSGGMNEAGLAVELMWLSGSRYPQADSRSTLDVLEWIQYQLDNHATVAEVLASDGQVRIAGTVPLHYLVADRTGQVATIELLDGRMVAHTGDRLPYAALANSTYEESVRFARAAEASERRSFDRSSLGRFAHAANRSQGFRAGSDAVTYAFDTLAAVAQPGYTQWSIVYELDRLRVHFRTLGNQAIRSVSLGELDFRCSPPVGILDLHAQLSGDVTKRLVPYTRQANRDLLAAAVRKTDFLADTPEAEIERLARLPEATVCRR